MVFEIENYAIKANYYDLLLQNAYAFFFLSVVDILFYFECFFFLFVRLSFNFYRKNSALAVFISFGFVGTQNASVSPRWFQVVPICLFLLTRVRFLTLSLTEWVVAVLKNLSCKQFCTFHRFLSYSSVVVVLLKNIWMLVRCDSVSVYFLLLQLHAMQWFLFTMALDCKFSTIEVCIYCVCWSREFCVFHPIHNVQSSVSHSTTHPQRTYTHAFIAREILTTNIVQWN